MLPIKWKQDVRPMEDMLPDLYTKLETLSKTKHYDPVIVELLETVVLLGTVVGKIAGRVRYPI